MKRGCFFRRITKTPVCFLAFSASSILVYSKKTWLFWGGTLFQHTVFLKEFWVDIIVDSPFDYDRVDGFWGRKVDFLGFGNLFKDDKMRYCQMTAFLGIPSHSLGVKWEWFHDPFLDSSWKFSKRVPWLSHNTSAFYSRSAIETTQIQKNIPRCKMDFQDVSMMATKRLYYLRL